MKGLRNLSTFERVRQTSTCKELKTAQIMAAESDYVLRKSVFENEWFESDMIRTNWEEAEII
jgi:hypothetical protein